MFLCYDVNMNLVKSGLIYGGTKITLDYYGERNCVWILNNATSEILHRVHADHFFGCS